VEYDREFEDLGEDLSISARLVINYMEFEHLVNSRHGVPFRDIVKGTGLSVRTVRKALSLLRRSGLVEATLDLNGGRRYLYRLNFRNLTHDNYDVGVGIHLLDVGVGTLPSMTFRAYRVLRQSNIAFHTDTIPTRLLEFTKCTCMIYRLGDYSIESFANLVTTMIENRGVVSIIMDSLVDSDIVKTYVDSVIRLMPKVQVYYVGGVSPIQLALELLLTGREETLTFRRGDLTIKIFTSRSRPVLGNYVKALAVARRGSSIIITEPPEEPRDELISYIVYTRDSPHG